MNSSETRYRFPQRTILTIVLCAVALAPNVAIAQESAGAAHQEQVGSLVKQRLALLEQRVELARARWTASDGDQFTVQQLEMDLLKAKLEHAITANERKSLMKELISHFDSMIKSAAELEKQGIARRDSLRLKAEQLKWKINLAKLSGPDGTPIMKAHFLEIVTPEADATCQQYAKIHNVEFSDPVPQLGNARTVQLADGITLAVRQPMHDQEEPVTRVYTLVPDIKASLKHAEQAGAEIAVPPMEIPDQGTIAIYFLGGIQHGLWQK